jgi:hypothetical protein
MTDAVPADQLQRVRVVNRNDFAIKDRFDGVPYVFKPNEEVDLPLDVANHILGWPGDEEDRWRHMAKRWGWNLPDHITKQWKGRPLWEHYCANVEITVQNYELRRVTDPDGAIPADQEGEFEDPSKTTWNIRNPRSTRRVGKGKKRSGWPKGKGRGPRKLQLEPQMQAPDPQPVETQPEPATEA